MAGAALQGTRRRIKSVDSTHKITKSMELVSISKLKKTKDRYESNKEYSETLKYCIRRAMFGVEMEEERKKNVSDKTLYLVVTSNMGLCGGYNNNICQNILKNIDKEKDEIVVIGQKGNVFLKNNNYKNVTLFEYNELNMETVSKLYPLVVEPFNEGKVAKVVLLYTEYINSLTFTPRFEQLLPFEVKGEEGINDYQVIFEPTKKELVEKLIPMYLDNALYGALLSASVSEHASRRTAMENASDNAEELKEELQLQYNKARQAAVTSELTEVIAGADAM